ncbi:unnamed protein product [Periconia digitata]|uniref:NDT80 domain-containing protein n=1 Tax=Periconia digitata TaxID=1303443 RepID=A0A9W4UNC2_9PLEO|nr:unnamed protein product [Periconia digitata]
MLGPGNFVERTRNHLRPRAGFQDSVDEANPVEIDYKANPWWKSRYSCWEVKGQVAEDYKDVGAKIHNELRQSCRESSWEVSVSPYMVGKSTKNAKPVIVIASVDESSREEAKAAIERSGILMHHPYFKLWPLRYLPTGPVNPVAMEDQAPPKSLPSVPSFKVYFDPTERVRLVGMPVYIRHNETSVRRATANAVYNGTDYGYITAAHACTRMFPDNTPSRDSQDNFEFPFDSDSESESADDAEVEALSHYSGTSPEATESASSPFTSSQTSETRSQSPGHVYATLSDTAEQLMSSSQSSRDVEAPMNQGMHSVEPARIAELELLGEVSATFMPLDCVVVSVGNTAVISFLEGTKNMRKNSDNAIMVSKARRTTVIAWTSRGPIHGSLVDLPLYMRLPSSDLFQLVYKFTYDGDIKMGDCGTLVIDTETRELYGHVIADSQHRRVAFMMAAEPVMNDIKENGNWQLITLPLSSEQECIDHIGAHAHRGFAAASVPDQLKHEWPPGPSAPASTRDNCTISSIGLHRHPHSLSPRHSEISRYSLPETPRSVLRIDVPLTSAYPVPSSPPFNLQENYHDITCEGLIVAPNIEVNIGKGFFLSSDRVWTCYRRNYFSVKVSYGLSPWTPKARLYLNQGGRKPPMQIQSIAVSLNAGVDGAEGKRIDLIQNTPKRDKGPQFTMKKELLAPVPPGKNQEHSGYGLDEFRSSSQVAGPQLPLQNILQYWPASRGSNSNYQHAFERIQFRSSTANNGKRRNQQQYYHLIVELWANVQKPQDPEPWWVRVAGKSSHPIVVRGRSPSYYKDQGPHNANPSRKPRERSADSEQQ